MVGPLRRAVLLHLLEICTRNSENQKALKGKEMSSQKVEFKAGWQSAWKEMFRHPKPSEVARPVSDLGGPEESSPGSRNIQRL